MEANINQVAMVWFFAGLFIAHVLWAVASLLGYCCAMRKLPSKKELAFDFAFILFFGLACYVTLAISLPHLS